jgi:DNA recombination protein RmuC
MTFEIIAILSVSLISATALFVSLHRKSASAGNSEELQARIIAEEKARRVPELESKIVDLQNRLMDVQNRNVGLETTLEKERQNMQEKLQTLKEAEENLRHAFRSLSSEALQNNNKAFLDLAKSTLEKFQEGAKTDLASRQKAINDLMTPVKDALGSVDKKINELEKNRVGAYENLKEQVVNLIQTQKELRSETHNLVNALRAPTVRGRWGEMQLKRVVEMAGMVSHCDFMEQTSATTEEGRLRPDMIVRLPGNKNIIVDAKAPLAAYLEALEAKDAATKTLKLKAHARQVRQHIMALGAKAYWNNFSPSPEFVVLFLPGETFFSAALEQDPELIELGADQKVILATPTTLIALLRAVSYGWRQEQLAANAKDISELGKELHKRIADLGGHFQKLGKHLGNAVDSYNQAVGTVERRVMVTARKFKELGAVPSKQDIEDLEPIDKNPRSLSSLATPENEKDKD